MVWSKNDIAEANEPDFSELIMPANANQSPEPLAMAQTDPRAIDRKSTRMPKRFARKGQNRTSASESFLLYAPAMIMAMEAMGVFANSAQASSAQADEIAPIRPLHPIESYGPVGFDFVGLDQTAAPGPFVIADDVLDAVHAGQMDLDLAMSAYWNDVPSIYDPALEDPAWIESAMADLTFEAIDHVDLSFGVIEENLDYMDQEENMPHLPILDDLTL